MSTKQEGGTYSFFGRPMWFGAGNGDGNGIGTMNLGRRSSSNCIFAQLPGIPSKFEEFPSKTEMEMDVDFQ